MNLYVIEVFNRGCRASVKINIIAETETEINFNEIINRPTTIEMFYKSGSRGGEFTWALTNILDIKPEIEKALLSGKNLNIVHIKEGDNHVQKNVR